MKLAVESAKASTKKMANDSDNDASLEEARLLEPVELLVKY